MAIFVPPASSYSPTSSAMLSLIQQAMGEMGLPAPASVIGNSNIDVTQVLYIANGLGNALCREYDWQTLNKQYIFTVAYTTITGDTTSGSANLTNASSIVGIDTTYGITGNGINQACYVAADPVGTTIVLSQPATSSNTGSTYTLTQVKYAMPQDYDRQVDRTHWDKTKHWEMLGPETAQQWEWLISGYIATGPRIRYRIFGNYFQIWPFTASSEVLGFEYVSRGWVESAAGVAKTSFTADTDVCIYPDRLIISGIKKRYYEAKGFDSSSFTQEYTSQLSIAKANDSGSATLSFAPKAADILITWNNVPDSGYG